MRGCRLRGWEFGVVFECKVPGPVRRVWEGRRGIDAVLRGFLQAIRMFYILPFKGVCLFGDELPIEKGV